MSSDVQHEKLFFVSPKNFVFHMHDTCRLAGVMGIGVCCCSSFGWHRRIRHLLGGRHQRSPVKGRRIRVDLGEQRIEQHEHGNDDVLFTFF